MTSIFLKVLMAATALVPVAATAQRGPDAQVDGRGGWNGQRGGDRGGDRGGYRGGRDQAPQQAQQPQVQQPQVQPGRPQFGDNGPRGQRDDRQTGGQPDRFAGRGDRPDRANWQGGRDGRPDVRPGQPNRGQGYQGQGYQGRDRYQGQAAYGRGPDGRGGYQDRGQFRGQDRGQDRGRDWGQYRGGYDQRQGYGRGGSWNRGWRNDNRYAWSNYRASNRGAYRLPRYYAPGGWSGGYRRFGVGFTLSSILFNPTYWIQDPYTYRLPDAYGPYRWVRYYNDALLVDLDSGRVVDTVYDIFW